MEEIGFGKEDSNGYITVLPECSEHEKNLLKSFLYRNEENGVEGNRKVKYKNADVLEAVEELKGFVRNLNYYEIELKYN